MTVPTYDQFIEPVLRFLASCSDGLGIKASTVHEAAANALGLDDAQRQESLDSGQPVYRNRAGWAHDRLKRAGLSESAKRGYWRITDAGRAYIAQHPAPLPATEVERLASIFKTVESLRPRDAVPVEPELALVQQVGAASLSPDDRLMQAVAELREATASDLHESLLQVSPARFEVIVLDVLHQLGYGTSRTDLQRVGGTGDGGIDGVISLDKLGLEKVYVQAKRWQNTVGRPELQAFYGALAGQKAKRGIFMTTSGFTAQAVDFVRSVEGIVLIDGARLVNLMMDHEVGVSSKALKIPKIDSDYFEE
ncbi:Mrr restriction system protein OS=Castellaniella defragrans (strain DSM / CCUG 39792 / 65Phen)OX=1437824 GN=BN940_02996 PE=4 SV=1 [Castellaniella denitrificans]